MFKDLLDDISWSMKLIMRIPPWIWTSKGVCFINCSDKVPRAPRAWGHRDRPAHPRRADRASGGQEPEEGV